MEPAIYRPTIAEIDLDAITHNLNFFKNRIRDRRVIMPVIKANAYGHGAVPIAKHLESLGVPYMAVACIGEGIELRAAGITTPILVLGPSSYNAIMSAFEYDITLTVFTKETVEMINAYGNSIKRKLKIHLKIDTGMGRIGTTPEEAYSLFQVAYQSQWINVEGIYTHFAKADEADKSFTYQQYTLFMETIKPILDVAKIPFIHLSNSAAMIDIPNLNQTMVRLGISLYGLLPSNEVIINEEMLKPALSLKTVVTHLKSIEAGKAVSYGGTFLAKRNTKVATLPIGYADGLLRGLSNKGYVLVNGKKAPIIGRICMDQTMIDVTDIEGVQVGEEVVIIGRQENNYISINDQAKILNTINYELVTLIGRRVIRIYKKNGEIVKVNSFLSSGDNNE